MAIDSGGGGGSGGRAKKQRADVLDDRCQAEGSDAIREDRISALPEELRLLVLTDLPVKDAIRTGALARGWRNLWKLLWPHRTSLKVSLWSRNDVEGQLDALAREPRPLHRLGRFSLIVNTSYIKSSEFQRFLKYATECGVEELHVETKRAASKLKFHLPRSSPALACLSLRDVNVSKIYKSARRPFHALEVIRLVSVSFGTLAFRDMLASCPSLLTLYLRRCKCDDGCQLWFDILPPNLKSLTIEECDWINSLNFVRAPTLRSFRYYGSLCNFPLSIPCDAMLSDLYIQFEYTVSMKECNTDKLRKSLPKNLSNLTVLTICYKALMALVSNDGVSTQLPNFNLHGLKELHLIMYEMEAVNLSNLYLFLKTFQCPNLEKLFVQLPGYRSKPTEGSIDQEEPPEDGLDNLVMVKINNFNWYPTEVQLLTFLLRKATSLRKLLILSWNVTRVDSRGAPEADLSLFNEALVNGKIVLAEYDNSATQPYHEAFIKEL